MLLTLALRRVRRQAGMRCIVRQPVSVDVDGLRRSDGGHQCHAEHCYNAQPMGLRRGNTSALEVVRQSFQKRSPQTRLSSRYDAACAQKDSVNPSALDRLGECRHNLEQVADNADVRNLEDRRIGVFVDSDHRFRALHADQMLNRA